MTNLEATKDITIKIDHFSGLNSTFAIMLKAAMIVAEEEGILVVPTCGLRTPWEQARLWKGQHSQEDIDRLICFRKEQMPFIVGLIEEVDAQAAPEKDPRISWLFPIQYEFPGFSMSQWGLAMDFVIVTTDSNDIIDKAMLYDKFRDIAEQFLLTVKPWGYVELTKPANILRSMSYVEIDRRCRERWGMPS